MNLKEYQEHNYDEYYNKDYQMSLFSNNAILQAGVNAANQQAAAALFDYQHQLNPIPPYIGPNYHPSISELDEKITTTEAQLRLYVQEREELIRKTPVTGPTPDEITQYPALKSLWEELKAGMAIVGIHRN